MLLLLLLLPLLVLPLKLMLLSLVVVLLLLLVPLPLPFLVMVLVQPLVEALLDSSKLSLLRSHDEKEGPDMAVTLSRQGLDKPH